MAEAGARGLGDVERKQHQAVTCQIRHALQRMVYMKTSGSTSCSGVTSSKINVQRGAELDESMLL